MLPKRVLSSDTDSTSPDDAPAPKRRALQKPSRVFPASGARANTASKPKDSAKKPLTQLHFTLDTTTLRTCKLCGLSYTRAAPDDETLHKAHCARVQRGMEWGREEERERGAKAGSDIQEVAQGARLKDGRVGRILCIRMDIGGKIGTKVSESVELTSRSWTLICPPENYQVEDPPRNRQPLPVVTTAHASSSQSVQGLRLPPAFSVNTVTRANRWVRNRPAD